MPNLMVIKVYQTSFLNVNILWYIIKTLCFAPLYYILVL